jgi:hypothetical protein
MLQEMLKAHPNASATDAQVACLEACLRCAAICTSCADACLAEESVAHLRECIRSDLDCAEVCAVTARLVARQTETDAAILRAQLEACAVACKVCGDSCAEHKDMHEHCRLCMEACRACEARCRELLASLG